MIPIYLLGFSLLPGLWGGCALIAPFGAPLLACTYGAVAECNVGSLKTCAVPVYTRDLSASADPLRDAIELVAHVRESDPTYLGKPTHTATAETITRAFVSGKDSRK